MKRLLWLGMGLAVGGLVVRAVTRKAQAYTPSGLVASTRKTAGGLAGSVRSFVDDVRDGMAERERQIHAALADGVPLDEIDHRPGRHGVDNLDQRDNFDQRDGLDQSHSLGRSDKSGRHYRQEGA